MSDVEIVLLVVTATVAVLAVGARALSMRRVPRHEPSDAYAQAEAVLRKFEASELAAGHPDRKFVIKTVRYNDPSVIRDPVLRKRFEDAMKKKKQS